MNKAELVEEVADHHFSTNLIVKPPKNFTFSNRHFNPTTPSTIILPNQSQTWDKKTYSYHHYHSCAPSGIIVTERHFRSRT